MEWLILGIFSASLIICISLNRSILWALAFGLVLFLLYGRKKGFTWRELGELVFKGIRTVSNILITFILIGVLTALWRAAGTIPVIVCSASRLIYPSVFLLMSFLLNCGVSFLTGTSFGTAATMGVICASMGSALNVSPMLTGGAVLSGAYFGDRCSPVSTSALLVAALTKTDIYRNIRRMARTALVPFLVTCALYLAVGFRSSRMEGMIDLEGIFSQEFSLHWIAILPAVVILVLAVCRVNVRIAMTASILCAVPICLFLQHMPVGSMLKAAVLGYYPQHNQVAALMSGGGILSMFRVAGIVCLSSGYTELFQKTGLLNGPKRLVSSVKKKSTAFSATLVTSVIAGMIACNQTLTILLTNQLCRDGNPDKEQFAIDLEDTAVVVAPLIPWSIAGAVPLSSTGAPVTALLVSFYLFLLPLWRLLPSWKRER